MRTTIMLAFLLALISCEKDSFFSSETPQKQQDDILTEEGIDSVLATLDEVPYSALDEEYLDYSHPERKFTAELKGRSYYSIKGTDVHKKVVGNFEIGDFIAHDEYWKAYKHNPDPEFRQYWLVDKKVLYMMLELIHALDELGHNKYGFTIRTAHRHPQKNADVNGASYSQHMFGKAIDINIKDINNDGEETQADKTIVYELLDDIVSSRGGLGKYPGSMHLHFDVRGFKARWDVP